MAKSSTLHANLVLVSNTSLSPLDQKNVECIGWSEGRVFHTRFMLDFNVTKWRPPCKCKHTCEEHSPNYPLKCRLCNCGDFNSYFACISCDQVWELHEVLYENDQERSQLKKPIGYI